MENLPPHMHLIIAGRSEPPLPVASLRGKRELIELQPRDMRFTSEEAGILLNQIMRLELSSNQVAVLEEITEGWAAGLQLAAMALEASRKDPARDDLTSEEEFNQFQSVFSGSHRYIFDYLAQEVVDRQPEHVRSFLLQTAILERLSSSLCDAITSPGRSGAPGNQAILEHLESSNLFIVPLDSQRQWYRYHHLFSSFLRTLLEQEYSLKKRSKTCIAKPVAGTPNTAIRKKQLCMPYPARISTRQPLLSNRTLRKCSPPAIWLRSRNG
jgi:LuxR family transcriptional regulator, maltose regulon positive regulatory protein